MNSAGPAASSLSHMSSPSSIAASSTTSTSSNYANSMWGVSSGSQPLSQGREKVIVDGSDLEEWPIIAAGDGARTGDISDTGGADGSGISNCSASWGERHLLPQPKGVSGGNEGGKSASSGNPSPPSSCSTNECMQPSSVVWGSLGVIGGNAEAAGSLSPISKASTLPGTDCSVGVSCRITGANFNPNANPSAWPALVQDGAGAAASEGGPTPLQSSMPLSANNSISVNQVSHQHQLHQMQYRDIEPSCREWGGKALDPGVGPKKTGVTEGGDVDCESTGKTDLFTSSSSSTSSSTWRAQPFPPNSKMGASKTETRESGTGGNSVSAEAGNSWGTCGQSDKQNMSTWCAASSGQTSGVSQGAWCEGVGQWGNSSGVGNPGGGKGDGSSSNSSSSGGSISNPSVSFSTPSTMSRALDNQKGDGGDGGAGEDSEWRGQGIRGGGGTSVSSGGGNSRSGSQHHSQHRSYPSSEVSLQTLLNRTDLDPRVLSNSGWGQTQIRQNVAWDLEGGGGGGAAGGDRSSATVNASSHPPYSGSTGTSTTAPSSSSLLPAASQNMNLNLNSNSILGSLSVSPGEGWDSNKSSSSSSSSLPSRGPQTSVSSIPNPCLAQSGGGVSNSTGGHNKPYGGWGESDSFESQGKSWGSEGQEWRDHVARSGSDGWGDFRKQSAPAGGDWGNNQEEKGTESWKEKGRGDGGNWGQRSGSEWREQESKPSVGGWGEGKGSGGTSRDSEVGTWGSWDDGAPRKVWEAGGTEIGGGDEGNKSRSGWGGNANPLQMPNSQSASLKGQAQPQQQSQAQQPKSLDTEVMQGGWGRQGGSSANSQSSGWTSGPIPQISSGPGSSSESSGWEEPSPQSLSRKKEIDDGTSAWGDPTNYVYVNYWDKKSSPSGQSMQSQQQGPAAPPPGRMPVGPGNRDATPTNSSSKGPAIGKNDLFAVSSKFLEM